MLALRCLTGLRAGSRQALRNFSCAVFADKFEPSFGSHLSKVLQNPAVIDDRGTYTYSDVFKVAGAIQEQLVNKVSVVSRTLIFLKSARFSQKRSVSMN